MDNGLGVRPADSREKLVLLVMLCLIFLVAFLDRMGVAKPHWMAVQPASGPTCSMDAGRMRIVIDVALSRPIMITDGEKEFVKIQHDHMSCEEYTRLFERSTYFKSPGKREALAKWHWETFHSRAIHGRVTPSETVETAVDAAQ